VAAAGQAEAGAAVGGRILRHPQQRKGLVSLRLCRADGELADTVVSKRQGELYKAARDVEWGDAWPPAAE
jgi:ribosomal protein RSM22 (predicted rRNA methylase)